MKMNGNTMVVFRKLDVIFSLTIQNGKVYLTGGFDLRLKVKPPVPTADAFL